MNLRQSLIRYGLSQREADVYLFLLNRVEASAFEIAKGTRVPRTTIYATLDSLKGQGIISSFKKNNVAYFTPESLTRLEALVREKEEVLKTMLPHLRSIQEHPDIQPSAKLYTGKDGLRIVLEDILETLKREKVKQLCTISHPDLFDYFPKFFPDYLKRRDEAGIYTKLIWPALARQAQFSYPVEASPYRETRFMPPDFPFVGSLAIYQNKIAFFSLKDDQLYSVILESPTISAMFRQFFLFAWRMLGREEK